MKSPEEIACALVDDFWAKGPNCTHEYCVEKIAAAIREAQRDWRTMDSAPRNGSAFLAYGCHITDNISATGKVHWRKGDHWWAIIVYDVWREVGMGGSEFVFAKDGSRTWSDPLRWLPLPEPPPEQI